MTQPGLAAIHPAAKLSPAPAARPAVCSHPPLSREADIFDEASALPLAGRAAFLDQACAGDSALRARVEGLLAGYAEMERALPAALVVRDVPRLEEQPSERIGRYKLLEGRGKLKVQVCTAIARELTGFIWAIGQTVAQPAAKK